MSSHSGKLMLIDANALIHRAYHALPPLTSPKGELVNAVFGFASALLKSVKDERPHYIVVCYDAGRHTFRNDIYDGYKAKRQETDEALYLQIPRTKQLVEALNIPLYAQQGVEADDLIGALAAKAEKQGLRSVIVTGDKDALQLVNASTSVYSLHKGVSETLIYTPQVVKEKMGVLPNQIVDYKALAGDSSDNIPGVPGIGPKTAVELLGKYKDIEGIYKHLAKLSERQQKLLKENKDSMAMSRILAKIKTDLKIELDLKEADIGNFDFAKAVGLFHELGFKSLMNRLPTSTNASQSSLFGQAEAKKDKEPLPHQLVRTLDQWQALAAVLTNQQVLVIDTETIDLGTDLIGVAFGWEDKGAYLPISPNYPTGLPLEKIKKSLGQILANPEIKKVGHNLKYDLKALNAHGLAVEGAYFDTMIASALVNSQLYAQKLDDLAQSELGYTMTPISDLIGKGKGRPMNEVPLEELAAYSAEDAIITWRLFEKLRTEVETPGLKRVFYEIEMPLLPILVKMEEVGIEIDRKHLAKLGKRLTERLHKIEDEAKKMAGQDFNLSSPAQLKQILFGKLQISAVGVKQVKTGLSTDAETLTKLKGSHPIIDLILEHRELSKLLNTYINALPKLADKNDRVHTTFQQIGAITGRMSSTNPNLQNIPVRNDLANEVRRCFVASQGKVLVGADYSQVELRIVAHLSDDPTMIEAFQSKDDVHAAVSQLLGVDRRAAKAINFGIIYGLGPNALANDLGIPISEAKQFIDRYLERFPGIMKFIEMNREQAREKGYTETLFGRKRYFPDIHSPNMALRAAAERMAVNMPSQGTVADIVKLAMIEVDRRLPKQAQLLIQIHDELLLEVDKGFEQKIAKQLKEIMSGVVELKVPLEVEAKIGPNWADLEPI